MAGGVVLWDFDGTLAHRHRGQWGACLLEVLSDIEPDHGVTIDDIRPHVRSGFPWHEHADGHPHLSDPEAWWANLRAIVGRTLQALRLDRIEAASVTTDLRTRYLDLDAWALYEDTVDALRTLIEAGWTNAIVSNHVPELDEIVDAVGLTPYVARTFSSARTGFEKPHRSAFEVALRALGDPDQVWMVGDNPVADIAGPAALGIPAILLQRLGPFPPEVIAEIDQSFAGNAWCHWQHAVTHIAPDAAGAASIILAL